MQQAQEFVETPADRQRELTKDATQEPQRELRSKCCSYPQKEKEALTTNGVYGLGSSESVASDTKHWNREPMSERPATKHPGHNTTRGLKQETWSRWLGEVTSASNADSLGVTPRAIKEDGEQTTPTRMTAGLSHPKAKRPRV